MRDLWPGKRFLTPEVLQPLVIAAATNNVSFPKRKPEGECERCWTAISRHKRYCEACETIVKAGKGRAATSSGRKTTRVGSLRMAKEEKVQ